MPIEALNTTNNEQPCDLAFAALAAMSMIGAAAGADETHRASVIIPSDASMVDGVPATVSATAPRKLMKNSKASNACAVLSQNVKSLLRTLVFEKAMELYRSVPPSSDAAAARADDNDERALQKVGHHGRQYHRKLTQSEDIFDATTEAFMTVFFTVNESTAAKCQKCLNFQWNVQDVSVNTQNEVCQNILNTIDGYPDIYNKDYMMNSCTEMFTLQSQYNRLSICQSYNQCLSTEPPDCSAGEQGDPYICKLSCDSGSCENYWFKTETKAECDAASTVRGCGGCKDQRTSNTILQKAQMPVLTDGFVSLCVGGLLYPKPPDCVDQRLC